MTTETRVHSPGFWPTKGTYAGEDFVGEALCAKCHANEAATWTSTPMAHASMFAKDSAILQQFPDMTSHSGPYSYAITKTVGAWNFSVTDGSQTISEPILWAFGFNHKGQAFLLERDGVIYDTRLSYYSGLHDLDIATGHPPGTPPTLEAALGRRMPFFETSHCFGCHTTASTISSKFDPHHATMGVTCEACHGPGAKHVAAMRAGKIEEGRAAIFNPATLGPVASVDFCGACHRTWGDVLEAGTTGVRNVRFQPYRLERSRCWGQGDARLKCTACHNPHEPIVREAAFYDAKCLACHVVSGSEVTHDHPGKACPVATKDCVTCHMPPAVIASMHAPFTDHCIRIARPGEPFPD
ncbi:MAG TPA: cytochrome c3 family protein [Candidatus Methylomirabilis sp.]|nr:cytochrome c3 family protein [Candidatus Methylomirabilis sp.]